MSNWPSEGSYRFDRETQVRVFTYKEDGLLSPMAHDLELLTNKIQGSLTVTESAAKVEVTIDLNSLEVHRPLTGIQRSECEKTMRKKVVKKGAEAVFSGEATPDGRLVGKLTLMKSRARDIDASWSLNGESDGRIHATMKRVRLRQTDYGIKPFKAMMGMLKLKDEIDIEIDAVLS